MGGIKIDKLTKTNFHELRQRIKMALALRDLDDMLDADGKPTDAEGRELALWKRRDTKASAIIGLTLGSEQLEHVSGYRWPSGSEVWSGRVRLAGLSFCLSAEIPWPVPHNVPTLS